ncbi:MAG: sigma-54 interaction domain-containing protein [Acidobacteriota bacterium]
MSNGQTSAAAENELGIIGTSLEMQEIIQVVQNVGPTDITVLITGESGVGKEVVAHAIHRASRRASKPMITVNCGAIPEGLIESELFGHEKGSFTGASESRKGYFELADEGTIFLDEIGELPLSTQVKFLRILENGEFNKVGSSAPRRVDVRVIAATNKILEEEVRLKHFRQDLFYRLRSINIRIPALREHAEDIPLLFERFAKEFSDRNQIDYQGITEEAMEALMRYYWHGNVRELRNVVESLIVIEGGKTITLEMVTKYLRDYQNPDSSRMLPAVVAKHPEFDERQMLYRALIEIKSDIVELKTILKTVIGLAGEGALRNDALGVFQGKEIVQPAGQNAQGSADTLSIEEMERKMIIEALAQFHGNRRAAAEALKISERTLYRKIKEYGLL